MDENEKKAIAVVGVGAVLPDALDVRTFWGNLKAGKYSIREVPTERWDPALYYDPDPKAPDKTYTKIGSWVQGFEFNPVKMGIPIPPRVIAAMDPAQQWAVDASWQALQDYGYPDRRLDPERVAVILGNALAGEYHYQTSLRIRIPFFQQALQAVPDFQNLPENVQQVILKGLQMQIESKIPGISEDTMPGELSNIIAGRVANVFNFTGPNFVTDAACASSFAALQSAVHGLRTGQYDAALTGGIDRNMGVEGFVKFCKIGALSPDGSRPYAEGANGFVMGEGAGVFLLKRLADAERDGDTIHAVIRGIGGSSDGKGKGITAPNPLGQQRAIERAWLDAGLKPSDATYIEGHGTSTRVGDVAEVESMVRAFAAFNLPPEKIQLGSVKSNIGHLKSAAGAAGLMKVIGSLSGNQIPANLNFERPNPQMGFGRIPFFVSREARTWERPRDGWRRAGVSSFGFGGTNFHVVLEEYVPGLLTSDKRSFPAASIAVRVPAEMETPAPAVPNGLFFISANSQNGLIGQLEAAVQAARDGKIPPSRHPAEAELRRAYRLAVDYVDASDLLKKLEKAHKAFIAGNENAWKMLTAQGIFRGQGAPARIAFMFPGQGSQYANMLRELAETYPVIAETYREADEVLESLLGRKLTDYIFADGGEEQIRSAENALRDTTITQPAVLTADIAMLRLLNQFGFSGDYVIGHSLGEYAALVCAGVLTFSEALQVVSARGREMSKVSLDDNGCMAAVSAPIEKVQAVLDSINGYVVIANINSPSQSVIAGNTTPVEQAIELCKTAGWEAVKIPVSHAFHTHVVAPASVPLRQVIERMDVKPPTLPVISNVTGEYYPGTRTEIIDLMAQQLASPVQFVKTMDRLYAEGVRIFVEAGPKRVLSALASDNLKDRTDVTILYTNHPRKGALPALNEALCALYAAGVIPQRGAGAVPEVMAAPTTQINRAAGLQAAQPVDGRLPLTGSVVISGAGLGLPGKNGSVFADENIDRVLNGEILIEPLGEAERSRMLDKRVTRVVKSETGAEMVLIDDMEQTIKLAGQRGSFDLEADFGVSHDRLEALDISSQLAIAAGIEALRDAGIPLVMRYRQTSTGSFLPDRWMLPEALKDETGVIFGSAFPGLDRMADETGKYYQYRGLKDQIDLLQQVRAGVHSSQHDLAADLDRRISLLDAELTALDYHFDRRFIFRILNMGHSQFAEYIGARGPNTAVNAACATTTHAVAIAEDWIRSGRCRRVIVVAGDDVTGGPLTEWIGSGLLATGATTTEGELQNAALPFDRRRNGLIMGMGAAALVIETEDAVRERGMRAICEVLGTQIANSAFHGTRLDVDHVSQVMENLVSLVEERFNIKRSEMAPATMFMSHETYTPARGGSAAAEMHALRQTFGEQAREVIIANTKGFTGHTMGVGIEDVTAVKALEMGRIPPIANISSGFQPDPDLGDLNLSRGGAFPLQYSLRLGAGFGSQIAMTLLRKIPGEGVRVNAEIYRRWLADLSGYPSAELETVQRTLRVKDSGMPQRAPQRSSWRMGTGPTVWAAFEGDKVQLEEAAQLTFAEIDRAPVFTPAEIALPAAETAQAFQLEQIKAYILELVSEKTGYPQEMLDMDLDLEADLGVDTVKQAELFAAVREHYAIPRRENLRLSDYNTLAKVVQFAGEALAVPAGAVEESPVLNPNPEQEAVQTLSEENIRTWILTQVSEKTGYPVEMLEPELDLEADLGVDTVKQAELFAQVREHYAIPRREDLRLSDYNTLARVIQFVQESLAGQAGIAVAQTAKLSEQAEPASMMSAETPAQPDGMSAEVNAFVLALVAEKTGYPQEMLDLDFDLEADLGVDTVKQAELFARVREHYAIPRREDLRLSDYNTLEKVIGFVMESLRLREEKATGGQATIKTQTPESETEEAADGAQASETVQPLTIRRRLAVPVLRPRLDLCKPTGITFEAGKRFVIVKDRGKVADSLARRLRTRQVELLVLDPHAKDCLEQVKIWGENQKIDAVFYLTGLDAEPAITALDRAVWKDALDTRVFFLYEMMRALGGNVALIAATRMGGLHGYEAGAPASPLGAGIGGFCKAYAWEQRGTPVKVVDFPADVADREIAAMLLEETQHDPGAVEVGRQGGQRFSISLLEQALPPELGNPLEEGSVFLVTGGAGGICVPILIDLAQACRGKFYITGRTPLPDMENPDLDRFMLDADGLKKEWMKRISGKDHKVTPVMIEKELAALERAVGIRSVLEGVRQAGGQAEYVACDVTDGEDVSAIIEHILKTENRLDVVIHAAGVEKSHLLEQKSPEEFRQVFSVKVDGFYNLICGLHKLGHMPDAFVSFSSIAGRLGNAGQTDYSAANDLLSKLGFALADQFPQTRFLTLDWGAWAEVGMASRGSLPKLMERAGIDMLPPAQAARLVRYELEAGTRGEVLLAGSLGMLARARDHSGGLDLERVNRALTAGDPQHVMLSRATGLDLYQGLRLEVDLDPTQEPFLYDHAINGTPVLPGVMGIEGFSVAATHIASVIGSAGQGYHITCLEDIQFHSAFKFFRDEPRRVTWLAQAYRQGENLIAHVTLESTQLHPVRPAERVLHFSGRVHLEPNTMEQVQLAVLPPVWRDDYTVGSEQIYRLYFHGPSFQVLDGVQRDGDLILGRLADQLIPITAKDQRMLSAPLLIELCLQTAGVWDIGRRGVLSLPGSIAQVRIYNPRPNGHRLYAQVTPASCGERCCYDARVLDDAGNVYIELTNYCTTDTTYGLDAEMMQPLRTLVE